MTPSKGPALEELVRAYLVRQGFFALRSVPFKFEDNDVTDLDTWIYTRQSAAARIRGIVDVKNKKSPKAFERVLWVRGLQEIMRCDRAIIATTDSSPSVLRFAQLQGIAVLSKEFLDKLSKKLDIDQRLTHEELVELVQKNPSQKHDGDWLRILGEAKSAVASLQGFPAFNRAMFAFKFFAERAEVRVQHREAALRCALLSAGVACIALDIGLEKYVFTDVEKRFDAIKNGVLFGDTGDGRVQHSIKTALEAIAEGIKNGKAIAAQAQQQLEKNLEGIRADVIAEYFMREHNAQHLFNAGRDLEAAAYGLVNPDNIVMPMETRSILGIFADYVGVRRGSLPIAAYYVDATISIERGKNDRYESSGIISSGNKKDEVSESVLSKSRDNEILNTDLEDSAEYSLKGSQKPLI
ncbi:hypothetical protein [Delftia tsuruhatensis]|uniref:hypothetical protein n=1 Tax=Delftia tsuruhatensis TaxID=180282 RepID=UPI0008E4699A|nr:hypothetical protein [Delftia tsuruhatensis]SFB53566.1 hypothetical protein SAMN05444579_108243 [Delftia tsuruhatensis]